MAYKYCVKENWGKGFFTHEERKQMYLSGHPGNVSFFFIHSVFCI